MDLIRALRIARHHRLLITSIVLGTAVVAVGIATYRNNAIQPLSRAEAPITFNSDIAELNDPEGTLLQVVQAQLEEARARAVQVNADLLADPANEVVADPTLGRLTFVARSADAEEAVATATEMRRRLLTRQPVNMETQIEEQLETIGTQMDEVRDQIAALDARTALPPDVAARRDRLTTLLDQLEAQALDLESQVLVPSTEEEARSPDELREDLDDVNAAIAEVTAELAEIPAPPAEFSVEMTERRALERQFRELEASLQDLVLQRSELSGEPISELVDVFDESPDAIARRTVAAVALLLGGGLAVVMVLAIERVRRPVWFPDDVPQVPFLATVPARLVTPLPWYIHTGDNPRKRAIQTLRSSIRARGRADELVVGVAGSGLAAEAIHTLGADLALSFASTHAATTLIDTSGAYGGDLPEFDGHGLSLSDVVSQSFGVDQMQEFVEKAIDAERSAHSSLLPIVAGDDGGVAADVLAGPKVGYLFDALREVMDVVVVVAGEIDEPSARAALDRTDLVLVMTAPGKTSRGDLVRASDEMAVHQIEVTGVMLRLPVFPRVRAVLGSLPKRFGGGYPTEVEAHLPASSSARRRPFGWVAALFPGRRSRSSEPVPTAPVFSSDVAPTDESDHRRETEPTLAPVVEVVGPAARVEVVTAPGFDTDPRSVLRYLEAHEPDETQSRAADFLVRWTTRVVEAEEGSGLDPTTIAEISTAGFVPLATWKGHPSLGSRLRHEFRRELGKRDAGRLEEMLLKAAGFGIDRSDTTSMDRWVSRHYFALHAAATDWQPTVWHVTSPEGTVSALIAAERLDSLRIEGFVDGVVIRAIERMARRQRRKEMLGDGQAAELESQMEDARALGLALAWLMDGSHDDSRLWYPSLPREEQPAGWNPDWTRGVKSNIAPLQRLGILAAPVLTEHELEILDPTG